MQELQILLPLCHLFFTLLLVLFAFQMFQMLKQMYPFSLLLFYILIYGIWFLSLAQQGLPYGKIFFFMFLFFFSLTTLFFTFKFLSHLGFILMQDMRREPALFPLPLVTGQLYQQIYWIIHHSPTSEMPTLLYNKFLCVLCLFRK